MEGRLQLIHQKHVFANFTDLKAYVEEQLIKEKHISLLAEPMVLLYGEVSNPNVVLVIGNKTNDKEPGTNEFESGNGFFFIDSKQMELDIKKNAEEIKKVGLEINEIKNIIKTIQKHLATLQNEIDNTQVGAGLAEDGSYVKKVSLTDDPIVYILDAESLDDADIKLDKALQKINSDIIKGVIVNGVNAVVKDNVASVTIDSGDIQIEEGFSEIEPDLIEDDHLHFHSGDTLSMAFAKTEKTYYTEREARKAADELLRTDLDNEVERATEFESKLREDLDNEIERATEIEADLRVDVDSANAKIDTFLANADMSQQAIDTLRELQNYIDDHGDEVVKIVEDINKNAEDIAKNTENLNAEIDRSTKKDEELDSKLDDEISRAKETDSLLRNDLDNEIRRAVSEDERLNAAISDEVKNRELNFATLSGRIDDVHDRVSTTEQNLSNEINRATLAEQKIDAAYKEADAEEKSARESAITEVKGSIDTLKVKLDGIEDGAQVNKIEKIFVDDVLMDITDNKEVKITMPEVPVQGVYVNDNILSLNGTELSANIGFAYDSVAKQLVLYGKDTTKVIATVDVSEFVKDGMIKFVELVTLDNGETVIRIVWNTDAGDEILDVPVNSLIQVYEAGDGLTKDGQKFSIKLNANVPESFLRVSADGLYTEGIKQHVFDSISASEEKTNASINTLSDVISGIQDEISDIENIAKNSFTLADGEGITFSFIPGTEANQTKILSGDIKGYYTYATKPETEKDSDFSLLRMTENGYMFVTNSTSAMKHTDSEGNIHFLSTYLINLEKEHEVLHNKIDAETERAQAVEAELRAELVAVKEELSSANEKIATLENTINDLMSGKNDEFLRMLKNAVINADTFKDDPTDPTVEVVVTDGESVLVKTREEAVYGADVIY